MNRPARRARYLLAGPAGFLYALLMRSAAGLPGGLTGGKGCLRGAGPGFGRRGGGVGPCRVRAFRVPMLTGAVDCAILAFQIFSARSADFAEVRVPDFKSGFVADRFQVALNDFHHARVRASVQQVVARVKGEPARLLSYEDVARKLQVTGRAESGRQVIPLAAIVGSVGRYNDFTRAFLPRSDSVAQRWARVKVAATDRAGLPPISVYRIGDAYFVVDGNHRVSVARELGLGEIEAFVIDVRTRVSLSADDDPDSLIVKAEYADFLAATRLDVLRPGANLQVSAAGQYAHLENFIEAHRYFAEREEEREIADEDAVVRWYDEAYVPLVEAIREQGILRYFPGRTETDLYVWIARHQAQLRNQSGWQVRPDVAVAQAGDKAPGRSGRWRRAVQRIWPGRAGRPPGRSWSQERLLARYSGPLFADILVLLEPGERLPYSFEQALLVAQAEGARLFGLYVADEEQPVDLPGEALEAPFYARCESAAVEGYIARERGERLPTIGSRALLADLVVVQHDYEGSERGVTSATVEALLRQSPRPVLVVPDGEASADGRLRSALLLYEGGPRSEEALFAATYMAEVWGVSLFIVTARSRIDGRAMAHLHDYLAMHEVEGTFLEGDGAEALLSLVAAHQPDLIVAPGAEPGRWQRRRSEATVEAILDGVGRPVFVCT